MPNDPFDDWDSVEPTDIDTVAAQGRREGRTYASSGFEINRPSSRDFGEPARFIYKVFDDDEATSLALDGSSWVVNESEKGRYQFKLLVAREAGRVKDLWIQRVPAPGESGRTRTLWHLTREHAARLINLLRAVDHIEVSGDVPAVRVDDDLIRDLFADPDSLAAVYREDPDRFRQLITDDRSAADVVAVARRREQVALFRRLLEDDAFFDAQLLPGRGREDVWQRFLEVNPWILGVSLTGQLLTGWNPDKLEQVVAGQSVAGHGKRADVLMRTAGRVSSLVFVEIKHHKTELLSKEYRAGCWAASSEVVGAIAQSQGTVQLALDAIGNRLPESAEDGSELPGAFSYLFKPRSYVIAGRLSELIGVGGGDYLDKIRSFELFRRHLHQPELLTFDELLARAEWLVSLSEEDA